MEYNTQQRKLPLPEYGRSVQNMVDHALTIEDREERPHLPGERQLVPPVHGGDLPPGGKRRGAPLQHGQPQGVPGVLGQAAAKRLPGDEPAH